MMELSAVCTRLMHGVNQQRLRGCFYDIKLIVDGVVIPSHRLVLAAASNFFSGILQWHHNEFFNVAGISVKHVRQILDFLYTGELEISTQCDKEILIAIAQQLEITVLKEFCDLVIIQSAGTGLSHTSLGYKTLERNTESKISKCDQVHERFVGKSARIEGKQSHSKSVNVSTSVGIAAMTEGVMLEVESAENDETDEHQGSGATQREAQTAQPKLAVKLTLNVVEGSVHDMANVNSSVIAESKVDTNKISDDGIRGVADSDTDLNVEDEDREENCESQSMMTSEHSEMRNKPSILLIGNTEQSAGLCVVVDHDYASICGTETNIESNINEGVEPNIVKRAKDEHRKINNSSLVAAERDSGMVAMEGDSGLVVMEGDSGLVVMEDDSGLVAMEGNSGLAVMEGDSGLFAMESDRDLVTVEGDNLVAVEGNRDLVTMEGDSDLVAMDGDNDLVTMGDSVLVAVKGNSDLVALESDNDLVAVEGDSDLVAVEGDNDLVAMGNSVLVAVEGDNDLVTMGDSVLVAMEGDSDLVAMDEETEGTQAQTKHSQNSETGSKYTIIKSKKKKYGECEEKLSIWEKRAVSEKCEICGQHFTKMDTLRYHMIRKHKNLMPTCEICSKRFSLTRQVKDHFDRCRIVSQGKTNGKWICPECPHTIGDIKMMVRHYHLTHTMTQLHTCPHCNQNINGNTDYYEHLLVDHDVDPTLNNPRLTIHKCGQCDFKTVKYSVAVSHARKHVSKADETSCHICGKVFKSKLNVQLHVKNIHENPIVYKCDMCGYESSYKKSLYNHLYHCHKLLPEDKPIYHCHVCDYSSISVGLVNGHMQQHAPKNSFLCSYCPKSFRKKSRLQAHETRHTGEKPYQCHMCDHRSRSWQARHDHILVKHNDKKKYICDWCGEGFKTNTKLWRHKRCKCLLMPAEVMVPPSGGEATLPISLPEQVITVQGRQLEQNQVILKVTDIN